MFTRLSFLLLILLLISAEIVSAEDFSLSQQWKNYFYKVKSKSKIKGERYFLSHEKSLASELKSSLHLLNGNKRNKQGQYYHCLFPARYHILKNQFPIKSNIQLCTDFIAFQKGIDIDDVYFVYTSAYPNNPASMFGHTFLRFSSKSRGKLSSTKELIGYSVAFQAQTNTQDNAFLYTLKGLFGGYFAYPEIKPQYINVGIYNNSESRDLWEFKLNLNENEKSLLIAHLWELSHAGAFNYYFFDENCSTLLLQLLKVIKPEIEFHSLSQLFTVPQTTYREAYQLLQGKEQQFRASLAKNILFQYESLNSQERDEFYSSLDGNLSANPNVLDLAVDYWKYKNYKSKANLKTQDKKLMFQTLTKRSQLATTQKHAVPIPTQENPRDGHLQNNVSLGWSTEGPVGSLRYGFHSFENANLGYDGKSYIKFFDYEYLEDFSKLTVIQIQSLQPFNLLFKNISWSTGLNFEKIDDDILTEFHGGAGLSHTMGNIQFYLIPSFNYIGHQSKHKVYLTSLAGMKYEVTSRLRFSSEAKVYKKNLTPEISLKLAYSFNQSEFFISSETRRSLKSITTVQYSHYW